MNFNFNVLIRLMLLNNLPEQGSLERMMNKRNVRNKISFSSEELDKLNLQTNESGITWNNIDDISVELTNTEIKFINDIISEISDKNLISEGMLDFVLEIKNYYDNNINCKVEESN